MSASSSPTRSARRATFPSNRTSPPGPAERGGSLGQGGVTVRSTIMLGAHRPDTGRFAPYCADPMASEPLEAATEPVTPGAFSMELSQDQLDVREWVHGFAANVVRPAAAEWDEREETPWPLIQEAAKIGLYSFQGLAQFYADETGLLLPIVNEELFWGDAGIGMAIMGTTLAVAGIFSSGTPEQLGEWVPQCYGTVDEPKVGAFCV